MNDNPCLHLLTTIFPTEPSNELAPMGLDYRVLFSEPNLPTLLKNLELGELNARRASSLPRTLHRIGLLRLIGLSGDVVDLRLSDSGDELEVELPLLRPPHTYRGPLYTYIDNVLSKIASIFGDKKPLVGDVLVAGSSRICRPKLGCTPSREYSKLLSPLRSRVLFPRLVYPTVLGWTALRVKEPKTLYTPWLCIGHKGLYVNILCLRERCEAEVDEKGVVLIEEEATYTIGSHCSKPRLMINYLLGNSYRDLDDGEVEFKKPVLWSPTQAIPIGVVGDNEQLELCIWNPYPIAKLHEIVFEKHRVVEAAVYSPELGEWENLEPKYNRVYVGTRPLAATRLRLRLRKIPPLLLKKR